MIKIIHKKIIIKCLDKIVIDMNLNIPSLNDKRTIKKYLESIFDAGFKDLRIIRIKKVVSTKNIKSMFIMIEIGHNNFKLRYGYKWYSITGIFSFKDYGILMELLTGAKILNLCKNLLGDDLNKNLEIVFNASNHAMENIPTVQNNSINGIVYKNKQKLFYKTSTKENIRNEIIGYILIKNYYPVPLLKNIIFAGDLIILLFEYEGTLGTNKGLLADYITSNINCGNTKIIKNVNDIFSYYSSNLKLVVMRKSYPLQKFYKRRITERIIPWYIESNSFKRIFDYDIIINNIKYKSVNKVIESTINYFEAEREFKCFLSQGDPTEMNLCLKPMFLDFDTAGYNPILCEFAIFFWSTYIAGGYFYPKYHREAYKTHFKVFEQISYNRPSISYCIDNLNREIKVSFEYKIPIIRKNILNIFLKTFKNFFDNSDLNDLKYHMILRILGTLNITKMDEYDMILSMCFVEMFYQLCFNSLNLENITKGSGVNEKTKSKSHYIS